MTVGLNVPWKNKIKSNITIEKRYKDEYGKWVSLNEKRERTERLIKRFLFILFLTSLLTFILLLFIKPPLPSRDNIYDKVIHQEPLQNKQVIREKTFSKGDYRYKIYPQFSYELYGLVVSEYDSENVFYVMHKKDPAQIKDLCVVWGDNILSGVYKDMNYKSGEFTCYTKPKEGRNWDSFSGEHLSNNHLIPADDLVADKIRKANIGDQIYIKGYLSRYEIYDQSGDLIGSRGTSIRRDDGGNHACETIFVTDFDILKGKNYIFKIVRNVSGIVAVISFFALVGVLLFL